MIAEVYASNIMPQQIARFLGCSPKDKEKIEEVRADFLNFLQERENDGIIYEDQILSWIMYKEWQIQFSSDEYDNLDLDKEEVQDMSWTDEIHRILYELVNTHEFLGNYSYIIQDGLPAQQ